MPKDQTEANLLHTLKSEIENLLHQHQFQEAKDIVIKNSFPIKLIPRFSTDAFLKGDFSVVKLIESDLDKIKFLQNGMVRSNNEKDNILLAQSMVEVWDWFTSKSEHVLFVLKRYEKLDAATQEKINNTTTKKGYGLYHLAIEYGGTDGLQIMDLLCQHKIAGIDWQSFSSKATPYMMAQSPSRVVDKKILQQLEMAAKEKANSNGSPLSLKPIPEMIKEEKNSAANFVTNLFGGFFAKIKPSSTSDVLLIQNKLAAIDDLSLLDNDTLISALQNFEKFNNTIQDKIKNTKTSRGHSLYHIVLARNTLDNANKTEQIIELLCKHKIEGIDWKSYNSEATPLMIAKSKEWTYSGKTIQLLKAATHLKAMESIEKKEIDDSIPRAFY